MRRAPPRERRFACRRSSAGDVGLGGARSTSGACDAAEPGPVPPTWCVVDVASECVRDMGTKPPSVEARAGELGG